MTGIAIAMTALLLAGAGSAPPPVPVVRVVRIYEPTTSLELIQASDLMLQAVEAESLVDVEPADLKPADFESCRQDAAGVAACLTGRLTAFGAGAGVVAVLLEPTQNGFRWTCVGRDMNPFVPEHQVFEHSFGARTDDNVAVLDARAAACLTYAGHQGGW